MRLPLFLLIVFITLLSSCYPRLYCPDRANVPAFTAAHEIKAAASIKLQTGETFLAAGADIAYAPLNHVGLITSYRSMTGRTAYLYTPYSGSPADSFNKTKTNLRGNRTEVGAGYFTRLGREGLFELYGGYGNGVMTAGQAPYHIILIHVTTATSRGQTQGLKTGMCL